MWEQSDEEVKVVVKEKKKADPNAKFRIMDPIVKELNNFDLAVMKEFPHKARENAMPI